jgi:hypothetical protein
MKITRQIPIVFTIVIGGFLASCNSMRYLTIPVNEPAPVFLPSSIQHVGILDRSLPSEETKDMDNIDKVLSAEGINLDKEAAETLTTAMIDEMKVTQRFEQVAMIEGTDLKNPGMGVFPAVLSWDQVNRLCDANGLDAIIVLSFFDTDTNIKYDADAVKVGAPFGLNVPALKHHAVSTTIIKSGWRIYDRNAQLIIDEWMVVDQVVLEGSGINPMNAAKVILGRKQEILNASGRIGQSYTSRLFPYQERVGRSYYAKGSKNLEKAKRRAETGDWNGASELWEQDVNSTKSKVAGRAHYNMAIINEINGEIEKAIDWASRSYSEFKDKKGLDYVRILQDRLKSREELQYQNEQ